MINLLKSILQYRFEAKFARSNSKFRRVTQQIKNVDLFFNLRSSIIDLQLTRFPKSPWTNNMYSTQLDINQSGSPTSDFWVGRFDDFVVQLDVLVSFYQFYLASWNLEFLSLKSISSTYEESNHSHDH